MLHVTIQKIFSSLRRVIPEAGDTVRISRKTRMCSVCINPIKDFTIIIILERSNNERKNIDSAAYYTMLH